MITIGHLLTPEDVALEIRAREPAAAIAEVASLLKNDPRILDWDAFVAGLQQRIPCLPVAEDFAICIPHVRSDEVTSLAMCAGRSSGGLHFPGCTLPIRYLFCIGVPTALADDYLRVVGLLVRLAKDPAAEQYLAAAVSGAAFVETLTKFEAHL